MTNPALKRRTIRIYRDMQLPPVQLCDYGPEGQLHSMDEPVNPHLDAAALLVWMYHNLPDPTFRAFAGMVGADQHHMSSVAYQLDQGMRDRGETL